jgi:hypothetical protein
MRCIDKPYFFFCWDEIHHLYYGIVGILCGWVFAVDWVLWIGVYVAADDIWQHIQQGHQLKGRTYQSPLARPFNGLYATEFWGELVRRFPFLKNGK